MQNLATLGDLNKVEKSKSRRKEEFHQLELNLPCFVFETTFEVKEKRKFHCGRSMHSLTEKCGRVETFS